MGTPSAALRWLLVDNDFGAWRCNWCAVEVVDAFKCGMGGEFGIEAAWAEKIEAECRLWEQIRPQVHWKLWVDGAQARDEMIFEGTYSPLCCVASVDMRRNELDVDLVAFDCAYEICGCFVVHDM